MVHIVIKNVGRSETISEGSVDGPIKSVAVVAGVVVTEVVVGLSVLHSSWSVKSIHLQAYLRLARTVAVNAQVEVDTAKV